MGCGWTLVATLAWSLPIACGGADATQESSGAGGAGASQPTYSHPSELFDHAAVRDSSTLRLSRGTESALTVDGVTLRRLPFSLFVFRWELPDQEPVDVTTDCDLYLPPSVPEALQGWAVIVPRGTADLGEGATAIEVEYAQRTAALVGVPAAACTIHVPYEQFTKPGGGSYGPTDEGPFSEDQRLLLLTSDGFMKREVAYAFAYIYMRAMTALGTLPEAHYPTEFITAGSSKRGYTQWLLGAADDRVAGFMASAFNLVDQLTFYDAVGDLWGGTSGIGLGGPTIAETGGDAESMLALLRTPIGQRYRAIFDPKSFLALLDKPVAASVGVYDPLFPIGVEASWQQELPSLQFLRFFSADESDAQNGHTMTNPKQVANWRALLQRAFVGRSIPELTLSYDESCTTDACTVAVTVEVSDAADVAQVALSSAHDDTPDLLFDPTWDPALPKTTQPMSQRWSTQTKASPPFQFIVERPAGAALAFFAEVEDVETTSGRPVRAYTTSLPIVLR